MNFRRLLVLAPAFPDQSNQSVEGVFIKEQVNYLKEYFSEINVVAPNTIWRKFLQNKRCEDYSWDNVQVYYPVIANLPVPYLPDSWKGWWLKRETRELLQFLRSRDIRFDLIHAHYTWYPGAVAVEIKKELGVPVAITEHTSVTLNRALERKDPCFLNTWSQCDLIIRVNRKDVAKIRPFNSNAVHIPNGYDDEKFYPMDRGSCRQNQGLPRDRKIILSVGSLDQVKGQKFLIEAMSLVSARRTDVLCLMVGSGPLKAQLQKKIGSLQLQNFVKLMGFIPHQHLPVLMSSCDLFVLPSLSEGNPTVMFEALGCGLPFIGSSVGGIPEVIASEDYGYIVEPADSGKLAQRILQALERDWDQQAIAEYAKKYSWRNIARDIISSYASIEKKADSS